MASSSSDIWNEFQDIWIRHGIEPNKSLVVSSEDLNRVTVMAEQEPHFFFYYANWCGPGTSIPDDTIPVDCLDLACKLHDTYFFTGHNVDAALAESVELLLQNNMITNPKTQSYARMIRGPFFFPAASCWRNRKLITVIAVILIITFGAAMFCFEKAKHSK